MGPKEKILWHNKELTLIQDKSHLDALSPEHNRYDVGLSITIDGELFKGYALEHSREEAIKYAIQRMEYMIICSSELNLQQRKVTQDENFKRVARTTEIATNLVEAFGLKDES